MDWINTLTKFSGYKKPDPNKSESLECLGKYLHEIISKSESISATKTQKIISKVLTRLVGKLSDSLDKYLESK